MNVTSGTSAVKPTSRGSPPEHVVPQILEGAWACGLPIVYNTGAYDSPDSLALMDAPLLAKRD
jgi:uncharacterized Fe-S radical SAM superfamily protein PflX